ncbi:hypothetical protein ABW19_dt0205461 [Dactylella cylindrospora]|nr:hypothetical protein ABW19_dt0205461 [Dactylella cylindrospora]
MLHKVAFPARRGYNWVCSDCRKQIRQAAGHQRNHRASSGPKFASSARPYSQHRQSGRTLVSRFPTIDPASKLRFEQKRFYGSDREPPEENGSSTRDMEEGPPKEDTLELADDFFRDSAPVISKRQQSGDEGVGKSQQGGEIDRYLDPSFYRDDEELDRWAPPPVPRRYPLGEPEAQGPSPESEQGGKEVEQRGNKEKNIENVERQRQKKEKQEDEKENKASLPSTEYRRKRREPLTVEKLVKTLDEMNKDLAKGGYQLEDPTAKSTHPRTITKSNRPTRGYGESMWSKFRKDYLRRYQERDPILLLGRGEGWRPTTREIKMEYQKWFYQQKTKLKISLANKPQWENAPFLHEQYRDILTILQQYTDEKTLEENKIRTHDAMKAHGKSPLDELVSSWRGPLVAFDPEAYKLELETQGASSDSGIGGETQIVKPNEQQEMMDLEVRRFRRDFMKTVDMQNLSDVFGVEIPGLPATGDELLALLEALSSFTISKQNIRYVLPEGYTDGVQFTSETIVSLIVFHERSGALNTKIMNVAINYQMSKNQIKRGRNLMKFMDYLQIPMDYDTFRAAIAAAAKAKDFVAMARLLRQMLSKGILPRAAEWNDFMEATHTPGQKVEILEAIKRMGMDPRRLVPLKLLDLAFDMYSEQLRYGKTDIPQPWRNLGGIPVVPHTVNKVIQFLYQNRNFEDARAILHNAQVQKNMRPNYETLKIVVRHNKALYRMRQIVSYIRVFEKRWQIRARGDIMEQVFRLAHANRYYNIVRTVWAHACLTNLVTKGMIDRMRYDIYETGRWAGKAGKLALGVASEEVEKLIKTPIWALRLVSKARDPLAYLASDGTLYQKPETWEDLTDPKGKVDQTVKFRTRAIAIRRELLRRDLVVHNQWKPRRRFSADLLEAYMKDEILRKNHPDIKHWTPMTWVWNIFQVRRMRRPWNIERVLQLEREQMELEAAERRESAGDEATDRERERVKTGGYAVVLDGPDGPIVVRDPREQISQPGLGNDGEISPVKSQDINGQETSEDGKDPYEEGRYKIDENDLQLNGLLMEIDGDDDYEDDDVMLRRERNFAFEESLESLDKEPIRIEEDDMADDEEGKPMDPRRDHTNEEDDLENEDEDSLQEKDEEGYPQGEYSSFDDDATGLDGGKKEKQ